MLCDNIRRLRLLNGLSQVELAQKLNVSKQCISNWENDNVLPSIEMLLKLSELFQVSTDSLLDKAPDTNIDVSALTPEQISHIRMIVADLSRANAQK